jgi:hypothetical protein
MIPNFSNTSILWVEAKPQIGEATTASIFQSQLLKANSWRQFKL